MSRPPKLWIVAERPVRLPDALVAAESLRDRFSGGIHFVRDESAAWQRVQWKQYSRYFDDVHSFAHVKSCRGLLDLPRLYRDTVERRRGVAALSIKPETDFLFCIAGVMGLATVIASAHPKVRKALAISFSIYKRLTRAPDRRLFRFTTSGWLQNRLVEPLAGVERTLDLKPRLDPGGDGARLVRLEKDPDEIFDTIVITSVSGRELPASGKTRFIAARYPSITELSDFSRSTSPRSGSPKRIIFFGTPFLLVRNLAPETYVQRANQCLDYLRQNYPGRDLIYRPHPFESKEAGQLSLDACRIENDGEPAELYFLERFAEIEAVFSVSSSVSRRAMTLGLNGYSFWRCFPFAETAARFFDDVMGDVPPEFEIRDFAQPPIAYQPMATINSATNSYGEALQQAVDLSVSIR